MENHVERRSNWRRQRVSVADSLKLPRIVLRTSSLFCVNVYASIPLLDDQGYFNQADSVFYEEIIMSPDDTSNFKKTKSSEPVLRIIWNSFTELEEPELKKILQYFPVPCFLIGPFHKRFPASSSSLFEPDRSSMSWLDHQSPSSVLYISFGSAAQLEEQQFLEVAHGLADSKQPFLWVMRPGFIKGLEGNEPLLKWFLDLVGERGCIVEWAPQQEVLAHKAIGAFWTHNGWNSTLESICEGVPMICSPFWGDQPLDARYQAQNVLLDDDFEDIEYVEASLSDPEIVNIEEENVVQQEEEEVDLEDISQIQDIVLREKLLSINRLIFNIESLNDNRTPDHVLNSFESDNSLSDNFSPEFKTFCDHTKETRSERLINLAKNNIPNDSSNDHLLEEADLFLFDNSIPPGIENVADDSKGDVRFLEELLIDDSILSHESSDLIITVLRLEDSSNSQSAESTSNDRDLTSRAVFRLGDSSNSLSAKSTLKDRDLTSRAVLFVTCLTYLKTLEEHGDDTCCFYIQICCRLLGYSIRSYEAVMGHYISK
nr:UDP-glycosyltransferase 76G1-like [Tanacetum cinerariifolium]